MIINRGDVPKSLSSHHPNAKPRIVDTARAIPMLESIARPFMEPGFSPFFIKKPNPAKTLKIGTGGT